MRNKPQNRGLLLTAIAAVFVFFLISSFGMHVWPMGEEKMSGCPLMSGFSSMCQMDAVDHISLWGKTFTAPLVKAIEFILLGILAFFIFFHRFFHLFKNIKFKNTFFYCKNNEFLKIFNHLLRFYSKGILSPKIYSLVSFS